MTAVALPYGMYYPWHPMVYAALPPSNVNIATSAATHRFAFIFQVPKTGTLDKFEWDNALYSGTNTVRCSFQDLDANGLPDGTQDQYRDGNPTNLAWFAPGLITSDGTDTGTKRSVTKGQWLAAVVEFQAYTSGSNFAQGLQSEDRAGGNAYSATYNGSAWTKSALNQGCFALKYDDGSYAVPLGGWTLPIQSQATTTFNTGSAADEIGSVFTMPFDATVTAFLAAVDGDGDFDVVLYDDSSNVLASVTVDKDYRGSDQGKFYQLVLTTDVELSAGLTYRLVVKPTTVTSVSVYEMVLNAAALGEAMPGGTAWEKTSRADAGSWTDDDTRRVFGLGLLLSEVDDGTGDGGGVALSRVRVGM